MKLTCRNQNLHFQTLKEQTVPFVFPVKTFVLQFQNSSQIAKDAPGINHKFAILQKVCLHNFDKLSTQTLFCFPIVVFLFASHLRETRIELLKDNHTMNC